MWPEWLSTLLAESVGPAPFRATSRLEWVGRVAEALGVSPAMEWMAEIPHVTVINHEPSLTIACRRTWALEAPRLVKTRWSPV